MDILTTVPLTNMIGQGLLTDAEHESETEFESLRVQEVALATDDETTCANEHTCRWCLGYLISVYPVHLASHLILPAWTVTHLKRGCLIHTENGHGEARRVFNDAYRSTV